MTFNSSFYTDNRTRLCDAVADAFIVIAAHSQQQRSSDTTHEFRQDSNFWYLTGINEPDMVLAIDTRTGESTLFTPELNDYQKEWDGAIDKKHIKKVSGLTQVLSRNVLDSKILEAREGGLEIGYLKPLDEVVEPYGFYSNPARRVVEREICSALDCTADELTDVRVDICLLYTSPSPRDS